TDSRGLEIPTTTPQDWAHRRGATSYSSNKIEERDSRLSVHWVMAKIHFAGFFFPTFANIAKKLAASRRARPAQSSAPKLARFSCRMMFAMVAVTASSRAHLV